MKYFLHDSNSFQDEKIGMLFDKCGFEGLGLFYTVLEKLAYQEKPINTNVLKRQLHVGKKLEKCWQFMEEIELISSNNGETFNGNLLKFSEKFQIKSEKNRKRIAEWRENQSLTKNVTRTENVCNSPKDKISKDKISKDNTSSFDAPASKPEKIPKLKTLHASAIENFCAIYLEKFHTKYIFSGAKDGTAIKQLLEKIKSKTIEANMESSDENILTGLDIFLKSITDKWVLDNFNPAVINLKFNDLFKNAKNGHSNNIKSGFDKYKDFDPVELSYAINAYTPAGGEF